MPNRKRQRSSSELEEGRVSRFVDSCVEFESNVSFHSPADGKALALEKGVLLLLGKAEDVEQRCAQLIPSLAAAHIACIKATTSGCHVAFVDEKTCILTAKTPEVCSRHNCPTRPDSVYTSIRAALKYCKDNVPLTVFNAGEDLPLSVAVAVARASSRSFSAKSQASEEGYMGKRKNVRVVLQNGNLRTIADTARCVQLCQRLVNAPTNLLDTVSFAEICCLWAERLKSSGKNVQYAVIKGQELREQGYGGLYGTGKAAEYPPHLVTLSYKPKAGITPQNKIAFVGKGIVYDTGGLAIKSRDGMCGMKHDMGGAAAVFGGFLALALSDAPLEMSCVLCMADNAVGPRAQRNDDIIILKSGISIEINNTDAEGRLVLSDGVYHASCGLPYVPQIIVDMATLTGAQGIATGKHHAAIFANTEEAEQLLVAAGKSSGDLCFPVIYCPEFHNQEFESEVADYKNSVKCRTNAQVSCAGQFIGNNLAEDYKGSWVHVDLASPAVSDQATGYGVSLLVQAFAPELVQ